MSGLVNASTVADIIVGIVAAFINQSLLDIAIYC
jgi:hypothetical protein